MREAISVLSGLAAFAVLAGHAPLSPAEAATLFNCARASTVIGYTAAGRGVRVDLLWAVTEPTRLEALLRRFGWEKLIGEANEVQLHYAMPSRYLLMATRKGCHLAHRYIEEAEAQALMAE